MSPHHLIPVLTPSSPPTRTSSRWHHRQRQPWKHEHRGCDTHGRGQLPPNATSSHLRDPRHNANTTPSQRKRRTVRTRHATPMLVRARARGQRPGGTTPRVSWPVLRHTAASPRRTHAHAGGVHTTLLSCATTATLISYPVQVHYARHAHTHTRGGGHRRIPRPRRRHRHGAADARGGAWHAAAAPDAVGDTLTTP